MGIKNQNLPFLTPELKEENLQAKSEKTKIPRSPFGVNTKKMGRIWGKIIDFWCFVGVEDNSRKKLKSYKKGNICKRKR